MALREVDVGRGWTDVEVRVATDGWNWVVGTQHLTLRQVVEEVEWLLVAMDTRTAAAHRNWVVERE